MNVSRKQNHPSTFTKINLMKKLLLVVATITSFVSTKAQTIGNGDYLDINNVKAKITSIGYMYDYEVPKESSKYTIFAGNLWVGGLDPGATLKVAGQTYCQSGNDFWSGPLDLTASTDSATISAYNKVWKLNQCDIDTYLNWLNAGSIGSNPTDSAAMNTITNWPTVAPSGTPLAPFADVNGNMIYDPSTGDYPLIKGDQAIFFVYNDKGGVHGETGGAAIGLEIQGMAYAYSCPNDSTLYNTIFTNYKIINKSSFRLDSAFIGNWTDFDIGGFSDDYVGCDVTRGAYYGYNGDLTDAVYGANPPAQGVTFLSGPWADPNGVDDAMSSTVNGSNYGDGVTDNERLGMSKFLSYNNDFSSTGNPSLAVDFYSYLAGSWKDGTPWTYGGTGHLTGVTCDYFYPATTDPLGFGTNGVPQAPWDETLAGNTPGDRRGLGSFGPFTFQPGAVHEVDFAYVYAKANSGGNLASVTLLQERIDSVKLKYQNGIAACGCASMTGINDYEENNSLSIYPNPANENITINFTSTSKNTSVKIYDATGRLIKNIENVKSGESTINISEMENGLYLINITDGKSSVTKRFVKQ